MTSNNLPEKTRSFQSEIEGANSALLEEILNASSWESAEFLCLRALPSCEVYSVRPTSGGWAVEIEYDNLLHEGTGVSELTALSNAIRGILEALELTRAS